MSGSPQGAARGGAAARHRRQPVPGGHRDAPHAVLGIPRRGRHLRRPGAAKPDPRFFELLVGLLGLPPGDILYVGDRLDTGIRPAAGVGLRTALIRRGPWGLIQQDDPDARTLPALRVEGLRRLPDRIAEFNAAEAGRGVRAGGAG